MQRRFASRWLASILACFVALPGAVQTFCGPSLAVKLPAVQRRAANGFMFFNMQGSSKEKFIVEKIFKTVKEEAPKEFRALEWQPLDARGTRYFNALDEKTCAKYYAASKLDSWPETHIKTWKGRGGRDEKVDVSFVEYYPPRTLPVIKGGVDIALILPGAAQDMGKKLYAQIFRETHRVLRRDGQFLVFTSKSEKVPATCNNYFEALDAAEGEDGVMFYLMSRKEKKKKVVDKEIPRQRVLGFSLDELEDAFGGDD
mmetsp:Transcript_34434/g.61106  ORF Transcript_34434/g.61106 Transcript_34434/m.61106 type:complete len:257 (-) Transcript_34434:145-915(-)